MNAYETINLCQPNGEKSCCACCGLFNFRDISRENLSRFLDGGASRSSSLIATGHITDQGDGHVIRDKTSYICPHQGLIYNKRPGCLLHPHYRNSSMRNDSFFGEKICSGFLCPAHTRLTTEHKKTIIELVDDWYFYSVAIIDPDSTIWLLQLLHDRYPIALQRESAVRKIITECLTVHSSHLAVYPGPIFFYSESEYNVSKENFSILSNNIDQEQNEIIAVIEKNL
ncbi:MAG: hypothetical protein A2176_14710 [Spirochaetes bacterium RBG_13_51_14]|nr:MAG: hypothetical protein A2176_14710 [Spirochaetes bacterium RBG_13_51_14]